MRPPAVPPHVQRLRPYVPGKPIEEVEREYGLTDIIKLASNENPLGPSPRVLDAITAAAKNLALYPDGACFTLVRALARHWEVASGEPGGRERFGRDHPLPGPRVPPPR